MTKKNNHEVELRATLTLSEYKAIVKKLQTLGAKEDKPESIKDIYFCPSATKSFKQIEMDRVGSYSLRLRESQKDKKIRFDLNVKTITDYGDHNAWEEHEITLNNLDEILAILKILGFRIFFLLEKSRRIFSFQDFIINLEKIKDFGPIIEVEIMTSKDKAKEAKQVIRNFLDSLSVQENSLISKSVTNLLMQERARF